MKKGILTLLIISVALMVASTALAGSGRNASTRPDGGYSQNGVYVDDGVLK